MGAINDLERIIDKRDERIAELETDNEDLQSGFDKSQDGLADEMEETKRLRGIFAEAIAALKPMLGFSVPADEAYEILKRANESESEAQSRSEAEIMRDVCERHAPGTVCVYCFHRRAGLGSVCRSNTTGSSHCWNVAAFLSNRVFEQQADVTNSTTEAESEGA